MTDALALQAVGNDWFLLEPPFDNPSEPVYYRALAGEAGVRVEARVGSTRATLAQASHAAVVRMHLTHLPLLRELRPGILPSDRVAAPRLLLMEQNPAWWEELRPYQRQAAFWAATRSGCILAHDLGLGKTRTALAASRPPILVLCPKSAISVWQDECEYAGLRCTTLEGRSEGTFNEIRAFFHEHRATTDVWLLNYHVAEGWVRYFCRLGPAQGIHTIVCDEAHYLQKRDLTWTSAINGIEREQCILLTATPLRNRLRSLWSLLNTAVPGAFGKEFEFRREYCGAVQGGYGLEDGGAEWRRSLRGREALARLDLRLAEVMHKLTRAQVAHEVVPLDRRAEYISVPEARLSALLDESATAAARLRGGAQTIAWYTDLRHRIGMEKVPAAAQLLYENIDRWRRIVVWVWHDDVVSALKDELFTLLPDVRVDEILGKTSQKKRDAAHRTWRAQRGQSVEQLDKRILIASIAAASQAMSFTTAGLAICVELDWAPLLMQQLEKRTHRFGQIHPSCRMVYCVLRGTIDETISEVLLDKAREAEDVLGEDGQVDQMHSLFGAVEAAEEDTNEAFMQRVAARLLAHKEG